MPPLAGAAYLLDSYAGAAIGDDTLQKEAGKPVDENGFTHGSSADRQKWFHTGHDSGDPKSCDTFGNAI